MDEDTRAFTNWRNQAVGKNFQDEIEMLGAYLPGVLLVPQWPQVQFFKGGNAKVVGEAWPDYFLFYYRKPFLFDAKATIEKDTYRPSKRFKHQFDRLVYAAGQGIYAFYLVNWLTYQSIEVFQVTETDTWPFKAPFGTGALMTSQEGNWLEPVIAFLNTVY